MNPLNPLSQAKQSLHDCLSWLEENDFDEKTLNKCWKALTIVSDLRYTAKRNK